MPSTASIQLGECPFCSLLYEGRPKRCHECGMLINEGAADVERLIHSKRKALRSRKAFSDTLFLIGLLLGGPTISFGQNVQLGLFLVLAAGFASFLSRYSDWSRPGTVLVGSLVAMVAASLLVDPAEAVEDIMAAEEARVAFAAALDDQDQDVFVHTRGGKHFAIWFTAPSDVAGECGDYPAATIREHLKDLGFRRVVVTGVTSDGGGLCSFRP